MTLPDINALLWNIPEGADYAADVTELSPEDIPPERVAGISQLLEHDELKVQFDAARILTSWGYSLGFKKLTQLIDNNQINDMIPHRLHPYDDTKRFVLETLISYYAINIEQNQDQETVRQAIFPYVKQIILDSGQEYFDLGSFLSFASLLGLSEYLDPMKTCLETLLAAPENQEHKIHDLVNYLRTQDPDYIAQLVNSGQLILDSPQSTPSKPKTIFGWLNDKLKQ